MYGLLILLLCLVASGTSINYSIPFFRSYHNPLKILSAFIPFLCLITAYTASILSWSDARIAFLRSVLDAFRLLDRLP